MRTLSGLAGEIRKAVEGEIDLARRSAELVVPDVRGEILRQMRLADHLHERQAWIDARENRVRDEVVAVLENDAGGLAVFDQDVLDGRFKPNLCAECARRRGDRFRHAAGAALRQAPR